MGYKTYEVMKKLDGIEAMAGFTNYVLTRKKTRKAERFATFLSGKIVDRLGEVKKEEGKNIWLLGGGQVNSLLAGSGLIDEMVLTTIPIVLGEGIPLFAQPARTSVFSLASNRTFSNGLVQSVYRKAGG